MKRGILFILIVLILLAGGGGVWWAYGRDRAEVNPFRTEKVTRGELLQTITSSGTLEPEEVIDVGSQVTGQIASFGKDIEGKQVDYRSHVQAGKVLATIDTSVYKSEVDAAQATLDQANASVASSQADLIELKAKLEQAKSDWVRAQKLGPSDALSEASYDSYKAAFEVAQANVGVGEAAISSAKASVASAQASLDKAQRNLTYCVIVSPVDGEIIDRRVNIGQTVVSALSVSSLFLIAKDLQHMQIWASVNEADVGNIYAGQPVSFTVDAFPNRTFHGTVGKLRYNAQMTNNVVTYTSEIIVDNSDNALIPYMTANVSFEVARHSNVLQVPNAALRYSPPETEKEAGADASAASSKPDASSKLAESETDAAEPATQPAGHSHGHAKKGTIWIADGNLAKPVHVTRGISDGVTTEVSGDGLTEGAQVIIGDALPGSDGSDQTVNPFTPKMPSRKRH